MVTTIFGEGFRSADSTAPADWIGAALAGAPGTVGDLVPNHHESVVRIHPPPSIDGDWWTRYRDLFGMVGSVAGRHTATPDRAWFGVWDGHGFTGGESRIAQRGPLDDEAQRALERRRAELRAEDQRRDAAISAELDQIPSFDLPHRSYYLLSGPVAAVTAMRYPGSSGWRNPDLVWPDDRRWFIATDVDFWSLYVAGDRDLTTELIEGSSTLAEPVPLDASLEIEV